MWYVACFGLESEDGKVSEGMSDLGKPSTSTRSGYVMPRVGLLHLVRATERLRTSVVKQSHPAILESKAIRKSGRGLPYAENCSPKQDLHFSWLRTRSLVRDIRGG